VAFFDTETGSDFLKGRFDAAGVPLLVSKTRAFKDLLTVVREAEGTCSVLIIDSISHVWTELMEAYQQKLRRTRGLEFQDWAAVKKEWRQFTDLYLNSKIHILLCGRAGYEYEMEKDEQGKKELTKVGTKMKAETEMGYEPSLLLEMVRIKRSEITHDVKDKGWIHRCYVLKDRNDVMDGHEVDEPTYASFAPVIQLLNLGGEHLGIDSTRNSEDMFESPDRSVTQRIRQVEIVLEEIKAAMVEGNVAGTSKDDKLAQVRLLKSCFGTPAWTAIEGMKLEDLRRGLEQLKSELGLSPPARTAEDEAADRELAEREGVAT
jgi:hypothetical protein